VTTEDPAQPPADAAGPDAADDRIPDPAPKHSPLWVVLSRWLLALEGWLRSKGGTGLRYGLRGFWALVAFAGIVLLVGPVINKPLTLDDITESASNVTDTWIARQFTADYRVTRTDDGRMDAQVEERITAQFPDASGDTGDDADGAGGERGIQRTLASQYQGHALTPDAIEATLDGTPLDVSRSETPDQVRLTLEGDDTLQGTHEFVLRYNLHDLAFSSTDADTGRPVDLLRWDVFGPSWPQGLSGLDVSVTIPRNVDEQLIRQPRSSLTWLMVAGGVWLDPEPQAATGSADDVTYRFISDENVPPHAHAGFVMSFEPGTFTMPPQTPLYWVQVYGPIAPLAFLALTLLLAFAARAVAWGDARGRPWFVAQHEPPPGISPHLSAQVLRRPRAAQLAGALSAAQRRGLDPDERTSRFAEAARVARGTGTIGDLPLALLRSAVATERRTQLTMGLRRIPRGFVRDLFIAAPLALTVVQWGLLRQLSYQATLSVVWWPVAFVVVSSVLALLVLAIALSARPLTRRGALVKQHLRGVGVYSERTQLTARGPIGDRLLPYAVLFGPPRPVGKRVAALIAGSIGETARARESRGDFSSASSLSAGARTAIRGLSLLLVAGSIVAVAVLPNPYPGPVAYRSYSGDVTGTLYTKVQSLDAAAELTRTDDGGARLAVTEEVSVSFGDEGARVPQFAQQWRSSIDGYDLGLDVSSVTVDGEPAEFSVTPDADTLLLATELSQVLTGTHDIRIEYALTSPVVPAEDSSGIAVDRIAWGALLTGWANDANWGGDPAPSPLRLELRVPDELAAEQTAGGWNTSGSEPSGISGLPGAHGDAVIPFGEFEATPGTKVPSVEDSSDADGAQTHVLDLKRNGESGYPSELTDDDAGATLDFPAGTFDRPNTEQVRTPEQLTAAAVTLAVFVLGGIGTLLGLAAATAGARRSPRAFRRGIPRDLARWLLPSVVLAGVILFVWLSAQMPGDDPSFLPLALATLASVVLGVTGLVLTRASRRP
jgi:hypothetical protein